MKYSEERKESVLKKMMPPHNRTIPDLAREEGISGATLYAWRNQARQQGRLLPDGDTTPEDWTSRDKFTAVLETATLSEAEIGEPFDKPGQVLPQARFVSRANPDMETGLRTSQRLATKRTLRQAQGKKQRLQEAQRADRNRLRELEKELERKDKALAETAALLVLRKKAQAIWGGRGCMTSISDRRKAIELVNEAVAAGARKDKACAELGISERTVQRWEQAGEIAADKRPTATRPEPANKLSEVERETILDTCHQPEYASLPPSQIVPRLVDQGRYLGSESTIYRVLREADEQHHRGRSRAPREPRPLSTHLC